MRDVASYSGGFVTAPPGESRDLHELVIPGVVDRDAHEVHGARSDAAVAHRARVAVCAVVHEPHVPAGDHRIPAVGLVCRGAIAERPIAVEGQASTVPLVAEDGVIADDVDDVVVGREPRDRGFGSGDLGADDLERLGIEHHQSRRRTPVHHEILGDEVTVRQYDEGVVRTILRQFARRLRTQVDREPVRPPTVHDVE